MVQALPNGQINVRDDLLIERSSVSGIVSTSPSTSTSISNSSSSSTSTNYKIGFIYAIDFIYDDALEQKTKNYSFFPETTKANIDPFTDRQNECKMKRYKTIEKRMLKFAVEKYLIDGEM